MSKELTDDWKAGKLEKGKLFWVLPVNGYPMPGMLKNYNNFEVFGAYYYPNEDSLTVLSPCDYDHFVELTEKAKKYDRIKINGNYPDKISKLKSRIKYLLELQANQDKELKSARWYQTIQNEDIAKLRQLLGECQTGLKSIQQKAAYPQIHLVFEEDYDALFCQVTDILIKIDEVLK